MAIVLTVITLLSICLVFANAATTYTTSVKTGSYATIKNVGAGKMLNVYGSKSANNTNITVYANDNTTGQQVKATSYNGAYYFTFKCSTSRALNIYGTSCKESANVCTWDLTKNPTQLWTIEYVSSKSAYIIRSKSNKDYCLTANGSSNSSNVCIKKYTGSNYQLWTSSLFSAKANNTTTTSSTNSSAKYNLVWPTNTKSVTGKYGTHGSVRSNGTRYHSGIDIGASVGSPCYAVANGTVVMCKNTDDAKSTIGGRGRYIVIYHENGNYSSLYEHLNSCSVSVGDKVTAGQKIGTTGNSGWASSGTHYAAHLHFGLMNGKMTTTGYDLWTVPGKTYNGKTYTNHTFEPDPAYNKTITYTYK